MPQQSYCPTRVNLQLYYNNNWVFYYSYIRYSIFVFDLPSTQALEFLSEIMYILGIIFLVYLDGTFNATRIFFDEAPWAYKRGLSHTLHP